MHTHTTPPVEGRTTTHRAGFLRTTDPDQAATVVTRSQKGGVGKTTLASSIATEASRLGARVLIIDADPNANLTNSNLGLRLTHDMRQDIPTLSDLLLNTAPGSAAEGIIEAPGEWQPDSTLSWREGGALQPGGALDLIAGSNDLEAAISRVRNEPAFERRLARILTGVSRQYDLVVIDCGPQNHALSWLTTQAAGTALIAATPSDGDIVGAKGEIDLLGELSEAWGEDLNIRVGGVMAMRKPAAGSTYTTQLRRMIRLSHEWANRPDSAATRPALAHSMPAPPGAGAKEWTAGALVFPEITRARSYYAAMYNLRMPLAWGLRPRAQTTVWDTPQARSQVLPLVLPWTRMALRTLQLVDAPVLARIEDALKTNPISGLWDHNPEILTVEDFLATTDPDSAHVDGDVDVSTAAQEDQA